MKVFVFAVLLITVLRSVAGISDLSAAAESEPCGESICTEAQKANVWSQKDSCYEAKMTSGTTYVAILKSECQQEQHRCNLKDLGLEVQEYTKMDPNHLDCQHYFKLHKNGNAEAEIGEAETKAEPETETKAEPETETKAEPETEPKTE